MRGLRFVAAAAWTLVGAVLLLPLPSPGAARADDGRPDGLALPGEIPRAPEFRDRVNRAIDRGVAWLRTIQQPDGSFPIAAIGGFVVSAEQSLGPTALGVYTLRSCGATQDDAAVARGLRRLREEWDRTEKLPRLRDTYGVALTLLALESGHGAAEGAPRDGDRYAAGGGGGGRPAPRDLEWARALARWLVAAQAKDGCFGYESPHLERHADHSNMQYALLGLKAARRMGVAVDREVFLCAARHLLDEQEKSGPVVERWEHAAGGDGYAAGPRLAGRDRARGWAYHDRHHAYTGSMTTGGVSSLAIARSELTVGPGWTAATEALSLQAVRDGAAWLGRNFRVDGNPGHGMWHYYYLYGLERAGVLAGIAYMAKHDWYGEGADYLLENQRDDGAWAGRGLVGAPGAAAPRLGPDPASSRYLDTCFALLFLRRATTRHARGGTATAAAGDGVDYAAAAKAGDAAFRDAFLAVFSGWRRRPDGERAARAGDFVRLGVRSVPLLVMHLEDDDAAVRAAAAEALERTTGETLGYAATGPAAARAEAVYRWEEWWASRRATLVSDEPAGRFRAP